MALTLTKRIPQQAGMGGGSADAAAVLAGLDRLYDTRLPHDTLRALAATIGADVPFCLMGGTALVSGIGERLEPLPPLPPVSVVIAQPPEGVDTAAAYRALDGCAIRQLSLSGDRAENRLAACREALALLCQVLTCP